MRRNARWPLPTWAQFAYTPNQAYAAARTQAVANTKLPAAANIATGTGAADVAGARRAADRSFRYDPYRYGYGAGYPPNGYPGYRYGTSSPAATGGIPYSMFTQTLLTCVTSRRHSGLRSRPNPDCL